MDAVLETARKGNVQNFPVGAEKQVLFAAAEEKNIPGLKGDLLFPTIYTPSRPGMLISMGGWVCIVVWREAPGFIQTPFNELLWGNPEKNAWISERTLAKRFGVPEDLTGTIQFLASQASDFMTGQVLLVDGGFLTGADTLFG